MAMNQISKFSVFRAFRSRNYLLYFIGRAVSQFGTWMQRTAVIWVVYSITHSAFMTGVTIFAELFPSFLFSFAGGVASDRYDRFRVIRITQVLSMIQAVSLALLVYTGHTVVWEILTLSVLLGIINAFDIPARQSLIHVVVALAPWPVETWPTRTLVFIGVPLLVLALAEVTERRKAAWRRGILALLMIGGIGKAAALARSR